MDVSCLVVIRSNNSMLYIVRFPLNDVWIAACCLEHGAALLTMDKHLQEIGGLLILPVPGT